MTWDASTLSYPGLPTGDLSPGAKEKPVACPLNLQALNEALSPPSLDLKKPCKRTATWNPKDPWSRTKDKNTGRGAKHPAALGFRANPYMVDEKLVCT